MSDKDVVVGIGTDLDSSGLDELLKKLTDVETFSSRVGGGFKQIDSAIAESFHASDLALQRYRERLETLSSQGAAPSPAQLQSLMQARLRAQEALGAVAPVAMETPEMMFGGRVAAGMGGAPGKMLFGKPGHEQMIEMGSPEYAALRSVLEHEVQVREEALAGLEDFHKKEKDVRSRDEQEGGGGGGGRRGSFARDAGSTALGVLGGLGVPLTIFGILEMLGIPKMFLQGPQLYEQRSKFGAMMGGLGLNGGVDEGYDYGYLQGETMPAKEAWGRSSGGTAGFRSMLRYSRAYSQDPNSVAQFGDMAFVAGPGKTNTLLEMIAAHTKDMTGGFAKLGDNLRDVLGVWNLSLATQANPNPTDIGAIYGTFGRIMGKGYTGRVGAMMGRMQGAITNPDEALYASLYRWYGGTSGAPFGETQYRISEGILGSEMSPELRKFATSKWGIPENTDLSPQSNLTKIMAGSMRDYPGNDSMQFAVQTEALKKLGLTEDEVLMVQKDYAEHGKITIDTMGKIQETLKGAQTEEEARAQANITAIMESAAHQETTANKIADGYMPILTAMRDMTATFMGEAVPALLIMARPAVLAYSTLMKGKLPFSDKSLLAAEEEGYDAADREAIRLRKKGMDAVPLWGLHTGGYDIPGADPLYEKRVKALRAGEGYQLDLKGVSSQDDYFKATAGLGGVPSGWVSWAQAMGEMKGALGRVADALEENRGLTKYDVRALDAAVEHLKGIGESTRKMADGKDKGSPTPDNGLSAGDR